VDNTALSGASSELSLFVCYSVTYISRLEHSLKVLCSTFSVSVRFVKTARVFKTLRLVHFFGETTIVILSRWNQQVATTIYYISTKLHGSTFHRVSVFVYSPSEFSS
jgi:hypothetical protein